MFPKELKFLLELDPMWIAASVAGAIILIAAIVMLVRYRSRTADDRKIEKLIRQHSEAYEKNIIISDGMYGFLFVDYLVLLKGRIVAMDVQHYKGYIFGGEQLEEWAQVVNSKSSKFKNPLYRLRLFVSQIKTLVKDADIEGRAIFTQQSSFPKGVPEGVIRMETFVEELNEFSKNDFLHEGMKKVFQEILAIAKKDKQRYNQETNPKFAKQH